MSLTVSFLALPPSNLQLSSKNRWFLNFDIFDCQDTAFILLFQLSPNPRELLLPKRKGEEGNMWLSALWCVWGSVNSVWFPWKTAEKHEAGELCKCFTLMSVVQVKSKPACLAQQAPPWNSLFRLFSCVATRNLRRTKGEWSFELTHTLLETFIHFLLNI